MICILAVVLAKPLTSRYRRRGLRLCPMLRPLPASDLERSKALPACSPRRLKVRMIENETSHSLHHEKRAD